MAPIVSAKSAAARRKRPRTDPAKPGPEPVYQASCSGPFLHRALLPGGLGRCGDATTGSRLRPHAGGHSLYPTVKRFPGRTRLSGEGRGERLRQTSSPCETGNRRAWAIVEMKLGFNLDLLLQAVDRMRAADEVLARSSGYAKADAIETPRVHRLLPIDRSGALMA